MMTNALRESGEPRRYRGAFIGLALAVGVLLGAGGVWLLRGPAVAPAESGPKAAGEAGDTELPAGVVEIGVEAQRNAAVKVTAVTMATLPTTLELTGLVGPEISRVSQVRALGRGVVQRVLVQVGQPVQRGQALLAYDNIELGERIGEYLSERAVVRQTESDLEVKQRAAERAEALFKTEAIAQQTLELRRAELRHAEAALASQQARLARVEEQLHRFGLSDADLERLAAGDGAAHRTASQATLRAPFDGIITKQNAAAGELVETDRDLFTIANLSTVWVQGDVYEKDLARVEPGVTVPIRVDAYPDRTFEGRLTYISDLIDPQARSAKVRCVVDNRDGLLKLDMFARLLIPTKERRQSLVVPTDAIQTIDDRPVVFVQQSATRFQRRDVEPGASTGTLTELLSGVAAGDRVVSTGSFYLKTALLRERIGDEH